MRVLVVFSNWTFPGKEGLHLQTEAWLHALTKRGLKVFALVFVRDLAQVDVAALQRRWGPNADIEVALLRDNYPLLMLRNCLMPLVLNPVWRQVASVIRRCKPDVVHFEGIGLAPLLRGLPALQHSVMSTVDAWSLRQFRLSRHAGGVRRAGLFVYGAATRWVEAHYFPRATAVHVVSSEDAAYLARVSARARVAVVPVGLIHMPGSQPKGEGQVEGPLLFWGDLAVSHLRDGLVWLLKEVLPAVSRPVSIVVLGRREPDEELASLAARSGSTVKFLTWVDDVDAVVSAASAVLLPDASGSGMKNRALHAMACGVPVIGTRYAFEGFDVVDGRDCFVSNDATAFAGAINALMVDVDMRARVGKQGCALVNDKYSLDAIADGWQRLYLSVVNA